MNLLDKLGLDKLDIAFICCVIFLSICAYPLVNAIQAQQVTSAPDAWQSYADMYDCQIAEVIPGKVIHSTRMIHSGRATIVVPTTSRQPDQAKWVCANSEIYIRLAEEAK